MGFIEFPRPLYYFTEVISYETGDWIDSFI